MSSAKKLQSVTGKTHILAFELHLCMLQKILEEKSHKTPTVQGTVKNKMQK
jgi:hypothetical protein